MALVKVRYTRNGGTKESDIYRGDLSAFYGEDFECLIEWAKRYGKVGSFIPLRGAAYLALLELVGDGNLDANGFPTFLFCPPDDCYQGTSWATFCAKIAMKPAYELCGWMMELSVEPETN